MDLFSYFRGPFIPHAPSGPYFLVDVFFPVDVISVDVFSMDLFSVDLFSECPVGVHGDHVRSIMTNGSKSRTHMVL